MSCVFLVTPLVIAGWPTFCAAASVAAASLGFRTLKNVKTVQATQAEESVELEVENSQVLTEQIRADDELLMAKEDIRVRIYKDARGQCAIHVMGEGKSEAELKQAGTELVNKIKQQYAYQKVTRELKDRGFSITQEEATEDGRIRIQLRKFE